jgi:hypothetical protein
LCRWWVRQSCPDINLNFATASLCPLLLTSAASSSVFSHVFPFAASKCFICYELYMWLLRDWGYVCILHGSNISVDTWIKGGKELSVCKFYMELSVCMLKNKNIAVQLYESYWRINFWAIQMQIRRYWAMFCLGYHFDFYIFVVGVQIIVLCLFCNLQKNVQYGLLRQIKLKQNNRLRSTPSLTPCNTCHFTFSVPLAVMFSFQT